MLIVAPNRNDVVVPQRAIFDQQDERPPRIELFANRRDRAIEPLCVPSTRTYGVDERRIGDATRARIDKGLKLLNVRVTVAPEAKHHSRRRSAAKRFGLGQERNGQCEDGRKDCDHGRSTSSEF
jgi:hypothetical protein